MRKAFAPARKSGLFLGPEYCTDDRVLPSRAKKASGKTQLMPGIVAGERVVIAHPGPRREKAVELEIRVALAAAGVLVMKHHVDSRGGARTGLGLGVADLVCVVPPYGRFLGIEVKRPGARRRTSERQKAWLAVVRRFGGITGVATSVEEALALVAEARVLP